MPSLSLSLSIIFLSILSLYISSTVALWPIPSQYVSGNTVLWIADDINFHFAFLPSVRTGGDPQSPHGAAPNSARLPRTRRRVTISTLSRQEPL